MKQKYLNYDNPHHNMSVASAMVSASSSSSLSLYLPVYLPLISWALFTQFHCHIFSSSYFKTNERTKIKSVVCQTMWYKGKKKTLLKDNSFLKSNTTETILNENRQKNSVELEESPFINLYERSYIPLRVLVCSIIDFLIPVGYKAWGSCLLHGNMDSQNNT